MSDFDKSLEYVKINEGIGYETFPHTDQPTNTGIIAADIADWKKIPLSSVTSDMVRDLHEDDIRLIYRSLWDKMRGDEILDQGIATAIFDTCVVRGLSVGVKYAQRTCNMLGMALFVDGEMGLHTIAALNQCRRSAFIRTFENLEVAGFLAIVAYHPEDNKYLAGWLNRAKRLFTLLNA